MRRPSRSPRRRSRREWAIRGLVAAGAAAAGYAAVVPTLGYALRNGNAAMAHRLSPGDGRVTAVAARSLLNVQASAASRTRADTLALTALRQDPTALPAVVTLGINAQLRGDLAGARRLFGYAETLSRRDLGTQLWAIEDAVGRGDVLGALGHYDIALRTSPSAGDLLFPILAKASADPAVRAALVATLARKPSWTEAFVNRVAAGATDARDAATLFVALGKAGVAVPEGAKAATVGGLIKAGELEQAWVYFASFRAGADRHRSRDPGFSANLAVPSPFDWTPITEGVSTPSLQPGAVDLTMPSSVGGALLQQMQMLPPGDYQITGHSSGLQQPEGALPYWVLTCWGRGELGRVMVSNSAIGGGRFTGRFRVPSGCAAQTLTLVARASDTVEGLSGQIDRVQLAPAS